MPLLFTISPCSAQDDTLKKERLALHFEQETAARTRGGGVGTVLFDFYVFRAGRLLVVLGLRLEIFLVTRDLDRRHVGFGVGLVADAVVSYILIKSVKGN